MSGKYLVTGTSSGLGAAIAASLIDAGHSVTGIDRLPPTAELAGRITAIQADLLDLEVLNDITSLIDADGWSGFVHCAGLMRGYKLGNETPAAAEELFRLHVSAAVAIGNMIVPTLPSGGRVILFASRAIYGTPERGLYAASKSALVGLARSWALTMASRGVTVNVIAPGPTDTPMLRNRTEAGITALTGASMPIGRVITPEEVTATAMFLVSPGAAAITGQVVNVCGGASLVAVF